MNLYYYKISFQKMVLKQVINLIFFLGEILFFCYLGVKYNLLSFAIIFLLFLITWNLFLFLKSYIYNTKEIIITNDLFLKYNGLKYFHKYEVDLELKNCKYFLIKTTIKSANYTLQFNHNNSFIFFINLISIFT